MQLQRGVRLGSQTTYAALSGFNVQEPGRFKNSGLKSKCSSSTVYIQDKSKMDLLM